MSIFAIVPKEENAERIVQAFRLLEEWLTGGVDVEEFRLKAKAVVGKA